MTILVLVAVGLAIIPLILILGDVFMKGAPAMSIGFLTNLPTAPNVPGGGIGPAIVGTFIMVGLAALSQYQSVLEQASIFQSGLHLSFPQFQVL
jgi:phosphate transport system permease protein